MTTAMRGTEDRGGARKGTRGSAPAGPAGETVLDPRSSPHRIAVPSPGPPPAMHDHVKPARRGPLDTFLALVERGGNALPHPSTLFLLFALGVIVLSDVAARSGLEVLHPSTGEVVRPVSLLTVAGLHRILTGMVTNFTGFAPLGTVLVALLGIGVAESSGLMGTALRLLVLSAPRR